jgi:Flp pilus assembly protein CpaB
MRLRRITRSAFVYWLAVAGLAGLTGLVVARLVGEAQAARARFGSLRAVVVATRAIEPGRVLTAGDVAARHMPAAYVPVGALASVRAATGHTVVVAMFSGEVVLRSHVAPAGLHGLAAQLGADERAVAVPAGDARPPVRDGDLVDVLASFEREGTVAIAVGARVLVVGADAVTVAVSTYEATEVADAIARGAVTLAVRSPVARRSP